MTSLLPVGNLSEQQECGNFTIDTSSDYLRFINIWYNNTGVYTVQLETHRNKTATYGTSAYNLMLTKQLWGLTIYDSGPQYAFVGLAGTHQPSARAGPRITSF